MFRFLRVFFLAVLAIVLIIIAVANSQTVPLRMLPPELSGMFQMEVQVPLFLLLSVFGGAGFAIGFSWEYLREWRIRAEGRKHRNAARALEREVKSLKAAQGVEEDDVLALLK